MKKHLVRFMLGAFCVLLLLGHAGNLWKIPFVSALDAYLYDVRVRLDLHDTIDERVVIIDVDEKSLGEVGRWPWGRNVLAELVRRLVDDYKVAVVGFDMVFAEPDESSGLQVLEAIGREQLKNDPNYQRALVGLRTSLDYDQLFADTLRQRPVVLGYYFSSQSAAQRTGALPPPVIAPEMLGHHRVLFTTWDGYGANLPALQEAAASGGHFNPIPDFDGSVRRVPLIAAYQGGYYEALSLAVVRTLLGSRLVEPGFPDAEAGIEWLDVISQGASLRIPVDQNVAALIPYRGREGSFHYVSAVDVLKGRVNAEQLSGRIMLVGTSALGLSDLKATPVGETFPGVEVHANLIVGMLEGSIKGKPGYVLGIDVLQVLVCGGLLAFLLPVLSPLRASVLALAMLLATIGLNFFLWSSAKLVLPLAACVLTILLLYGLNMAWGYFTESRTRHQFVELFGQYVPPELVDEMVKNPEGYSMEGQNEELTVLFSDIRSFTSISEGMDPKELSRLMNDYLGSMTEVIRHHRGTLDKYMGDAIMAFWGAPVNDPGHARNAVLTALGMRQKLRELASPFKARLWPQLQIGIGINTGTMTVGDMGSPVRKAYTVMGDAVNLGARLEGITKEYGVDILVGEETRRQVDDVVFREIDWVKVKGKDEPVTIYEPLALASEVTAAMRDELKLWQHVLVLYRAQAWDQAGVELGRLQEISPECRLYTVYVQRIAYLRAHPPGEAWDGVTVFQVK